MQINLNHIKNFFSSYYWIIFVGCALGLFAYLLFFSYQNLYLPLTDNLAITEAPLKEKINTELISSISAEAETKTTKQLDLRFIQELLSR